MELPTIGQRCAFEDCKQLDFLPFTCSHCQLVFCKDHYMPDPHACQHVKTTKVEGALPIEHYQCTFPLCTTQNSVEMYCPVCKKHFCLAHRHHGCIDVPQETREKEREKWEAPLKQFEAAKADADREVVKNLSRVIQKSAANKTAIKVQLMRLKGKAVGLKSVPTADRVYFLILMPLTLHRKSKAIFVGRHWTIGRVIDAASDVCDVPNKNNKLNSDKLRLFRLLDGAMLTSQMDKKLDDLLKEESIIDGESLVLEYTTVESDCLADVSLYKDFI